MRELGIRALVGLIRAYQLTVGQLLGGHCRFHPSCSEYAIECVRSRGALAGGARALWRVLRCGPWSRGGVDYPSPRPSAERPSVPAREKAA